MRDEPSGLYGGARGTGAALAHGYRLEGTPQRVRVVGDATGINAALPEQSVSFSASHGGQRTLRARVHPSQHVRIRAGAGYSKPCARCVAKAARRAWQERV